MPSEESPMRYTYVFTSPDDERFVAVIPNCETLVHAFEKFVRHVEGQAQVAGQFSDSDELIFCYMTVLETGEQVEIQVHQIFVNEVVMKIGTILTLRGNPKPKGSDPRDDYEPEPVE